MIVANAGSSSAAGSPAAELKNEGRIISLSLEAFQALRQEAKPSQERKFSVIFTGDTHSYLDPSVASFVSEKPLGGIVRRIQYFDWCRKNIKEPVLFLDAGDFLQGTMYFEMFGGEAEIKFMNLAGYRVATMGNHDFDEGWEHLEKLLEKKQFEAICANIFREGETKPILPPYSLLKIEDRAVAVVGIMGEDSWRSIGPMKRKGLTLEDPAKTMDRLLPEIRPYADLVILLSHSGIQDDRKWAAHPLVDMVVGGHSHTLMQKHEIVAEKPVFHGFRHGQLAARMDLTLSSGALNVESSVEHLDERYDAQNPAAALLNSYKSAIQKKYDERLGECVESLPSKDKMNQLIPLGAAIAEMMRLAVDADMGIIPSGSIKVGIEKGPFTVGVLHGILPHREELCVASMKGSLLAHLIAEGEKRWGKQRTFQYSGKKVEDQEAIYKVAAPPFFFEREIMDGDLKILPEFQNQVVSLDIKEKDLRDAVARVIKKGVMPWIEVK